MQPSTTFDDNTISSVKLQTERTSSLLPSIQSLSLHHSPSGPSNSTNNTTTMAANSPRSAQATSAMPPPAHPASIPSRMHINILMSPPDQTHDSFYYHTGKADSSFSSSKDASGQTPMSPPISPCNRPMATTETPTNSTGRDIVLYPDDASSSPAQIPLFPTAGDRDHSRTIEEHIQKNINDKIFVEVQPPTRNDYELVVSFQSQLNKAYAQNPKAWMLSVTKQARDDNHRIALAKARARPLAAKAPKISRPRTDNNRVLKPPGRTIRVQPTNSPRRPTPQLSVNDIAEPKPRAQGPDKDFASLPDLCPPPSVAPDKANWFKVDWKGQPLDNSKDPNRHLLSSDEITLASNLRLDCATYLASKRRIFIGRLSNYRRGKGFRKTDAQQACKIDVNKASKLWMAFDNAKWFREELLEPFKDVILN
ncbi:hypothetical protein FPRO05_13235 [Fusarium proliferatum]|uniref:SWIRM domain-containing protein n=1 Tax=Gibberella intermedia TaxID=948311 RepID=A0A365N1N5_GIBIN|nr:hypothetical protein FPRO05_13235 [Fusarium proliferatum]